MQFSLTEIVKFLLQNGFNNNLNSQGNSKAPQKLYSNNYLPQDQ